MAILQILSTFLFLTIYKFKGIIAAAVVASLVSLVDVIKELLTTKKISNTSLFSIFGISTALIMAYISIKTDNVNFVKMKLTIINIVFFLVVLISKHFFKKNIVKELLFNKLNLTTEGEKKCFYTTLGFFICSAVINEIVWRNFEERIWVFYKVFGTLIMSILFAIIQSYIASKHSKTG